MAALRRSRSSVDAIRLWGGTTGRLNFGTLAKEKRPFSLAACGQQLQVFNRARLWLVHRAPAGGKPALRCSSPARHASSGMARRGLLALARLLLLTPSVSAQTCALLRSHLPSNAHRAREQPVAHCRLSAHLPVRLALVRAVSRTSHSVSHGVGHGVTHSVTHSVSHALATASARQWPQM